MRPIANLILIPLLVLCPIFCGAAESVRAAHLFGTRFDPIPDAGAADRGPDRDCCPGDDDDCPQDADDCLCKGAVQAEGPRAADDDHPDLAPALDGLPLADHLAYSRLLAHRTRSGFPIGWASRFDASRVRAVLQNFRC